MSRLIFLFAIAALIYLLVKSYRKSPVKPVDKNAEDMVQCAQCGVHLPVGESLTVSGQSFCCASHRDLFQK